MINQKIWYCDIVFYNDRKAMSLNTYEEDKNDIQILLLDVSGDVRLTATREELSVPTDE